MSMLQLAVAAQVGSQSDGLTLHEVVASLPRDPASLFVIALLTGGLVLVLWSGRPRGKGGRQA
ncbi:MAG: hypothetical protein OEN56_07440 [Gemmatimonadota bacterium]|nr:hypothetical protein [Gemmatimonadota bacterium]